VNAHPGQQARFLAHELSGALGDLGTFLPLVLGILAVAGYDPASIFTLFGLFYLATAALFRIPVSVQPMKIAAAAVLTGAVTPAELSGATLFMGGALLLLGLTGAAGRLADLVPRPVSNGILSGLGILLGLLGVRLVAREPLIGLITLAAMIPLGFNRLLPQALTGLLIGVSLKWATAGIPVLPACSAMIHLPKAALPAWDDIWRGTIQIGLPQLSLTLVNAVIVTASLAERLFPHNRRVTPRRLTLSMGVANCLSALLGGFPMCHGAGGLAGHYHFGARTSLPALLLGSGLLTMGLFFADYGGRLLALVPLASLGALLFWSSVEMVRSGGKPGNRGELATMTLTALLTIWGNAAMALVGGIVFERLRRAYSNRGKSENRHGGAR
jgi:MFS superfamily sulfate permease-like transporter